MICLCSHINAGIEEDRERSVPLVLPLSKRYNNVREELSPSKTIDGCAVS